MSLLPATGMGEIQTRIEKDRVVLRGAVCLVRQGRLADASSYRRGFRSNRGAEFVSEVDSASYRPRECVSRKVTPRRANCRGIPR